MSEPLPQEFLLHNQEALAELVWAIESSVGHFSLMLARCNYLWLRQQLIDYLRQTCELDIRVLVLEPEETALYTRIQDFLQGAVPGALMVFGLEGVTEPERLLSTANQVREEFRKHCPFPIVLWITDEGLTRLVRYATDLESWATTTTFSLPPQALAQGLQQTTEAVFATLLAEGKPQSFEERFRTLGETVFAGEEVPLALAELQTVEATIAPALQAEIAFLCGLTAIERTEALTRFQQSLALWQPGAIDATVPTQLKVGVLRFYIAQTEFAIAEQARQLADWRSIQALLDQAIQGFEQAGRSDLVAKCLILRMRVLQKQQAWTAQAEQATQALALHQALGNPLWLVQDYGFRARAALEQQQPGVAREAALTGLHLLETLPGVSPWLRSLHLLFLALAERQQGQVIAAIAHLRQARFLGDQGRPSTYIRILEALQALYYEQGKYRIAFRTKRERLSIEQQYGIRAFVGAGRLQPRREAVEAEPALLSLSRAQAMGQVAPEIEAAGRQQDLERLLERIGRNDYRLIVIHGNSGVGKSSLVNAGLVPALRRKPIGTRPNVVVVVRVYTDWMQELAEALAREVERAGGRVEAGSSSSEGGVSSAEHGSLSSKGDRSGSGRGSLSSKGDRSSSERGTSSSEGDRSGSGRGTSGSEGDRSGSELFAGLMEQLRWLDQHNRRTILVFDQFEEFFFVYPKPEQRRSFFHFLGECLQVLSLNLVLSLRQDYLHLLLELNRAAGMQQSGIDILSGNVLYGLGNFAPPDAEAIIQRLTERTQFYLEPALVQRLVQDLAGELGEVRPIELQIAGAQLQTEAITTLTQYRQLGETPKEALVERYLAEVVRDCGREQGRLAELVLYLLTDEKGTRPLKTRVELEKDLADLAVELPPRALDLVLQIFVNSGLVVLLPETPLDRFQLVHDYLAEFIRQQQEPRLSAVMAELAQERQERKRAETAWQHVQKELAQAQERLKNANAQVEEAEKAAKLARQEQQEAEKLKREAQADIRLERSSIQALRALEFSPFDGLLEAMRVGIALKQRVQADLPLEQYPSTSPLLALATTLDNVRERTKFKGHQASVVSASFSPDGQCIVTVSVDGRARLWDIQGNLLRTFRGHQDSVRSASFSPDGQCIVTASDDKTVKLWNLEGNLLQTFKGHQASVRSVSFSPDEQCIVTASADKTVRLWNLEGNLLQEFKGHQDNVSSVSFSPDGQCIVTASDDKTARLWDIQGSLLQEFKRHWGRINSVSFSPDGQCIVTASVDGIARLWDIQGNLLQEFKGHQDSVRSASFSPDGQRIVTASADKTVRLWNLEGNLLQEFKGHQDSVRSASFNPDGQRIVTASDDNTARLWDLQSNSLVELKGHRSSVRSASFSPDSQRIVTASLDGRGRLWDLQGNLLQELRGHKSGINGASFSPDGQRIAMALASGLAQLWDVQGNLLQEFQGYQFSVRSANFSPDGQRIVTASDDNTARLWDLKGNLLQEFKGHRFSVWSASFSPDGQRIVTASLDKTARLWDIQGSLLQEFRGHRSWVWNASFSPDGQRIVTASDDNTARLWDFKGNLLQEFKGHQSSVRSASFSPDGQRIVTASEDKTARLWDFKGNLLQEFKGHQGSVNSASFSPDGQRIVTASADKAARLWPVEDLDQLLHRGCTWLHDYLSTTDDSVDDLRQFCGVKKS